MRLGLALLARRCIPESTKLAMSLAILAAKTFAAWLGATKVWLAERTNTCDTAMQKRLLNLRTAILNHPYRNAAKRHAAVIVNTNNGTPTTVSP
jgi:hypothetical protein